MQRECLETMNMVELKHQTYSLFQDILFAVRLETFA